MNENTNTKESTVNNTAAITTKTLTATVADLRNTLAAVDTSDAFGREFAADLAGQIKGLELAIATLTQVAGDLA